MSQSQTGQGQGPQGQSQGQPQQQGSIVSLKHWNADLSDFLLSLDNYHPTVPDSVVQYHLSKSGVNVKDPRISRLVALAADKFLAEIIFESKQSAILKKRNKGKDKRKLEEISECLQLSDLSQALQAKRISISRRIRDDE
jgi:transcription initiation factor TFIID subunit 10